jgi:peroxiredoxin
VFQDQVCSDVPLLSDFPKNQASRDYDAYNEETGISKRVSVVIDKDRVVRSWYTDAPDATEHVAEALRVLETLN